MTCNERTLEREKTNVIERIQAQGSIHYAVKNVHYKYEPSSSAGVQTTPIESASK